MKVFSRVMGIGIRFPDHAVRARNAVADCSICQRREIGKQSPNGAGARADDFLTQAVHEIFFPGVG